MRDGLKELHEVHSEKESLCLCKSTVQCVLAGEVCARRRLTDQCRDFLFSLFVVIVMTTYDFNPAEVLTLRGCKVDDLCFNATGSQRMLGKRLPCKMSGRRADGEDAGRV